MMLLPCVKKVFFFKIINNFSSRAVRNEFFDKFNLYIKCFLHKYIKQNFIRAFKDIISIFLKKLKYFKFFNSIKMYSIRKIRVKKN
jgi:hypothetical protein